MRVLYFSSDEYAMFAGISIISMLENNSDVEELEYYLLGDNISFSNREKIENIFKRYGKQCKVLDANLIYQSILQKYGHIMRDYNGGKTSWLRMFPDMIFPEYNGTVLFMDSDTIVDGSIEELCNLKWMNKVIAAVDISTMEIAKWMKSYELREEGNIIRNRGYMYFNAGIVLYNMKNFNENNCRERINQSALNMKEFTFIDQSVLNATLGREEVLNLNYKYNYFFHLQPRFSKYVERIGKIEDIDMISIDRAPTIVHYLGQNGRPWFKESISRLADLYKKYRELSPWRGVEFSFWDSSYYKNLKLKGKIEERIKVKVYHTRIYGYYCYIKDIHTYHMAEKIREKRQEIIK